MQTTEKPPRHRNQPRDHQQSATDSIRLQPANVEAEKALIGSLLLDPTRIDEVAGLLGGDAFYLPVAGNTYAAIHQMVNAGEQIDPLTVYDRMQKAGQADEATVDWLVGALNDTPHSGHAYAYAQQIAERYDRRSVIRVANEAMRDAFEPTSEIEQVLSSAEGQLHEVIERRTGGASSATDIRAVLLTTLAHIQSGKTARRLTGYHDLDNMTGGLPDGGLVIVAARPGVGKTTFAGNLAYSLAKAGTGTLFVSIEQSRVELAARFLSCESGVSDLVRGRPLSVNELNSIMDASSRLESLPIEIDDTTPQTVAQIAARARMKKRKAGIGCLIVDYLQLIDPADSRVPREQQVANITRSLKSLARQLEIPVVALAQLNRGIESREDKRPRLSDLRESGAVEQDADVILFLDRPYTYREEADPTEATLYVAKHRNGRTGLVPLHFDGATFSFKNACHPHQTAHAATQGNIFGDDSF